MLSVVEAIHMSIQSNETDFEPGDVVSPAQIHPFQPDLIALGAVEEITEDPIEPVP